jgi:hypothetical protein
MDKMEGAQGYLDGIAGEGLVAGLEIDSGGDTTVQVNGGVGGLNISPFGPATYNGGVVHNWVDRWDWASWG